MRSLQDEIRQALRDLFCPICSRTFTLNEIRIRSLAHQSTVEISVICNHGHFPVILIVPIMLADVAKAGLITPSELKRTYARIDSIKESIYELIPKKSS